MHAKVLSSLALAILTSSCTPQVSEELAVLPPPREVVLRAPDPLARLKALQLHPQGVLSPEEIQRLMTHYQKEVQKGSPPTIQFIQRDGMDSVPVIGDYTLELSGESLYDQANISCLVRTPNDLRHPLGVVVLLGDPENHQELLENSSAFWVFALPPSRPHLGYELLGEGDFWQGLRRCQRAFPDTERLPTYLVSDEKHAESALKLADHYRGNFSGVAVTGGVRSTWFPNLTDFPVVGYGDLNGEGEWDVESVLSRLEDRGSRFTARVSRVKKALKWLHELSQEAPPFPLFSFSDYQYARPWPWVEVLTKEVEDLPCSIEMEVEGEELFVQTQNVRSCRLFQDSWKGFPKEVKKVRWNGALIGFSSSKAEILLGDSVPRKSKAVAPGGVVNFFRNEPVVIVYQDRGESSRFTAEARLIAQRLGELDFKGLPKIHAHLPVLPLSQYQAKEMGVHRAIFIGTPKVLHSVLSSPHDSWPAGGERVTQLADLPSVSSSRMAYTLSHPSERSSQLRLALAIAAPDEEALSLLKKRVSLATFLAGTDDLSLWECEGDRLLFRGSRELAGDWQFSSSAEEQWSQLDQGDYLRELVSRYVVEGTAILPDLRIHSHGDGKRLQEKVPDRDFALVTLQGSGSTPIANHLLKLHPACEVRGLEHLMDRKQRHFEKNSMRRQIISMVVDGAALKRLSPSEKDGIEIKPLAKTLHEMILEDDLFSQNSKEL